MARNFNQLKAIFGSESDKQKMGGLQNPMKTKSTPTTLPTQKPAQISTAPKSFNLGMAQAAPQYKNPAAQRSINPTAVPSLPGMPKTERFGKIKKYFKS